MSNIDKRISNLGRRLGTFTATAKLRVTEWGPVREIHLRERVGGRFIWRLTEATRAIKKRETLAGKLRHLARLKSEKRYVELIVHLISKKHPTKVKDVVQQANDLYKKGGKELLVETLKGVYKSQLRIGTKEFDAELFALLYPDHDNVSWVSVTSGEPI